MTARLERRTIVVTRAEDQAGRFSTMLRDEGATVLEVPLITIGAPADDGEALHRALERLDEVDWLVVTSPNGASRVAAAVAGGSFHGRLAAVGRGTEEALGRPADLVPVRQVAEGLLDEFPADPGRVLLVQGDRARPLLAEELGRRGWRVDVVVAYRTLPRVPDPDQLNAIAAADALTFTSGSAVTAFVEAGGAAVGLPPVVASIGPITTAVAERLGLDVTVTAAVHGLEGLVDVLGDVLGPRPATGPEGAVRPAPPSR